MYKYNFRNKLRLFTLKNVIFIFHHKKYEYTTNKIAQTKNSRFKIRWTVLYRRIPNDYTFFPRFFFFYTYLAIKSRIIILIIDTVMSSRPYSYNETVEYSLFFFRPRSFFFTIRIKFNRLSAFGFVQCIHADDIIIVINARCGFDEPFRKTKGIVPVVVGFWLARWGRGGVGRLQRRPERKIRQEFRLNRRRRSRHQRRREGGEIREKKLTEKK